ncbi:MAG: hypothetical protein HY290_17365 [Planctomycetia bacterium]|nr:hypothetical protein [Planctomycetia bacterium]
MPPRVNLFAFITYATFALSTAVAADPPEIVLWPQGMPEPVVPADPPENSERGKDGITRRTKSLRAEIQVDAGLPPTFIAQMGDDTGSLAQGSTLLYLDLVNRKIPAEIHIYEKGGHGFGMRARPGAPGPTDWQLRAVDWLKLHGYIAGA